MEVELTRSGGLPGIELTTAVDSDDLPEPDARRLAGLIERADLEALSTRSPLRGRGADRYQYDLVVHHRGARYEVTASEDAATPELRALIDWLLHRAADRGGGARE